MAGLPAHFAKMARNNRWANHVLLRACAQLDVAAFTATRTSFFPSIAATVNHILAIDRYYLDALEDGGVGLATLDGFVPFQTADAIAKAQRTQDEALMAFCDRMGEADMSRMVVTDRGEDGRVPERIDDLLAHLFQHQIHHRGQVHAMMAGTSVKPPQLDEFFLDFDRDPEISRMGLA